MKNHTTVKLTKKAVLAKSPCPSGYSRARRFLPATLSTDPEQNVDLALKLADRSVNVGWLASVMLPREARLDLNLGCGCTACAGRGDARGLLYTGNDPTVIAQQLAAIADTLATARGR